MTAAQPAPRSPAPLVAVLRVRDDRPHAPGYQRLLDDLEAGALSAVAHLGWPYELVACDRPAGEVVAAALAADVVVLLGGEDLDPAAYGGPSDYPGSGRHEPRADAAQIAVVHAAIARGVPLLGICRGHQLVNVALGGTLVQHLDSHRAADAADPYVRVGVAGSPGHDGHEGHDRSDGLAPEADVLCTHHQAIATVGAGLRVVATAPDGVIEAVVHESAPLTGVQWHPEHPATAIAQLVPLLRRLDAQRPVASAPAA